MPEGYDQINKRFVHTERNLGLGLDMQTSPRDTPEGNSPDVRAILFRGGNIIPAKLAVGGARVTEPNAPISHCTPYNTRTAKHIILLSETSAWALTVTHCNAVTPGGGFGTSKRWEGYQMMHGITPVIVVNNNGVDAPHYWDGKAPHFEPCVTVYP